MLREAYAKSMKDPELIAEAKKGRMDMPFKETAILQFQIVSTKLKRQSGRNGEFWTNERIFRQNCHDLC